MESRKLLKVLILMSMLWLRSGDSLSHCTNNQCKSHRNDRVLRILTNHFKPFMVQNEFGRFDAGIEYELIKTIAEKENLHLTFEASNQLHPAHINQMK